MDNEETNVEEAVETPEEETPNVGNIEPVA